MYHTPSSIARPSLIIQPSLSVNDGDPAGPSLSPHAKMQATCARAGLRLVSSIAHDLSLRTSLLVDRTTSTATSAVPKDRVRSRGHVRQQGKKALALTTEVRASRWAVGRPAAGKASLRRPQQ
jgi:hypothetical protein